MATAPSKTCKVCGSNTHVDLHGRRMHNSCTKCQAQGLHWGEKPNGKFDRFEDTGDAHVCGVVRRQTPTQSTPTPDDAPVQQDDSVRLNGHVTPAELKVVSDEVAIVKGILQAQETKQDAILNFLTNEIPTKAVFQQYEAKDKEIDRRFKVLTQARPITVTTPTSQAVNIGRQHYMFPNLLTIMVAIRGRGVPFLVGEPGSFKTAIVYAVAKAMNLNAEVQPVGMQTSKSDLIGFMSAGGQYVDTAIYRTYTKGGVCLIDEIDAANSNVLTIINSILANDEAGFPDGQQKRHPDCHFIVAGNTFGKGADVQFVGRAQLDQATLNRFVYIPFDTDWDLVGDIMGVPVPGSVAPYPDPDPKGRDINDPIVQAWGKYVKDIHDILEREGVRASIGSRSVLTGVPMLMAGVDPDLVEYATIRAHLSPEQWDLVQAHLATPEEAATDITDLTQGAYWVRIANYGDSKLMCIKTVREVTALGLKAAKDIVEQGLPMHFETQERQEFAVRNFVSVGPDVEVQHGVYEPAGV